MFKINDKVRIEKKQEKTNAWVELGKGIVRGIIVNKGGEQVAIRYRDREWIDKGIFLTEIVMIDAPRFRVRKT